LHTAECEIGDAETAGELTARLAELGARALLETLEKIENGTARRTPQNHTAATYYPMLKKSDGKIDLTKSPREIVNFVRGMNPWPCAFLLSNYGEIRVHAAKIAPNGELQLDIIQAPNGRKMKYKDFINGHKDLRFE
jgi:methionyl-tRNA formyltransferase